MSNANHRGGATHAEHRLIALMHTGPELTALVDGRPIPQDDQGRDLWCVCPVAAGHWCAEHDRPSLATFAGAAA